MEDFAIRVTGLSKRYKLSDNSIGIRFSERIKQIIFYKHKNNKNNDFYALKDVSFVINRGEAVGIIGRNGAGKSTLLKILSEVVEPTHGKIEIKGKIASILEIGMGFHPDLTGRENIFLSGILYGLSKKQIEAHCQEIIDFSGLERFIDTPVKHFSSGMYTRLAFALITHIDADIFLFDEVLAVGDFSFQIKCYQKIRQLIASGKTVLIVSHNNIDIMQLCSKAMYLENGRLVDFGDIGVVKKYFEKSISYDPKINTKETQENQTYEEQIFKNKLSIEWENIHKAPGDEGIKILKIFIKNESRSGEEKIFRNDRFSINFEFVKQNDIDYYDIGCAFSYMNIALYGFDTACSGLDMKKYTEKGKYSLSVLVDEGFSDDTILTMSFCVIKNNKHIVHWQENVLHFKIAEDQTITNYPEVAKSFNGPIRAKLNWNITKISEPIP